MKKEIKIKLGNKELQEILRKIFVKCFSIKSEKERKIIYNYLLEVVQYSIIITEIFNIINKNNQRSKNVKRKNKSL